VITILGVVFVVMRYVLFHWVFIPLGTAGGIQNEHTLSKFCEASLRVIYYLPIWIWGAQIALDNKWIPDTLNCFRDFYTQFLTDDVALYYEIQFSFYLILLITLLLVQRNRKDFWQMFAHHTITVFLLGVSWWQGYYRIGIVVFFCMDLCDFFLEASKMFNYLKWERLSNLFFGSLVFAWIIFRILLFPILVISPVYYDSVETHKQDGIHVGPLTFWFFNLSLFVLQILQYYWFYLILMVVINVMRKGGVEAARDEIESVDDTLSVNFDATKLITENNSGNNNKKEVEDGKLILNYPENGKQKLS